MKLSLDLISTLTRLFFSRFFDRESLSPQGEPEANVIQALGFLAAPGAFVALLFCLLPLTTAGWNLIALRCLFLTFSMVVMGLIVVFEGDALFLDHRDYQVLLPLPLPVWTLFVAKMMALGLFLGLFLVDINLFASLFWPSVDEGNVLQVIGVHLLAVTGAGFFSAVCAASAQGLVVTLVPARFFRPVATFVQAILMAGMAMLLFVSPLISSGLQPLIEQHSSLLRYFPVFWFAGFYESLRPAVRSRTLLDLGQIAMPACGYALAIFVATYLPLYRRHARKLIETEPRNPAGPGRSRLALNSLIDRSLLASPVQQAVYHFIGQTISRSMKHRLFLATYAGFGAAMVIVNWTDGREGLMRIPLTLSFVLISGMRAAFNFPAELSANWAFQTSDMDHSRDCLIAMRKWILVCGLAPLFLLMVPVELALFPWRAVLFQLLFGIALSLLLMEIMFFNFRKIPFTCGYFPGKTNLVLLIAMYVTGFSLYSSTMARLEALLLPRPAAALAFICTVACAWLLLGNIAGRNHSGLDYQDEGDPEVRRLGLTPS